MKRLLYILGAGLLIGFFTYPYLISAATAVSWTLTNISDTFIFPSKVNGVDKGIIVSASSTVGDGTTGLTTSGAATTTGRAYFAGKVGIGTTTPQSLLHVQDSSTGSLRGLTVTQTSSDTLSPIITYQKQRGSSAIQNGDKTGTFWFAGYDGTNYQNSAGFQALVNGTVSAGSVPTDLTFVTGTASFGFERMRVTSSGNVGIGSTSPYAKFSIHASSTGALAGNTLFAIGSSTATATTTLFTIDNVGSTTLSLFGACSGTNALTTTAAGLVACGLVSSGSAFPFTPTTNFAALTNATNTPVWLQQGLQASSTSRLVDAIFWGTISLVNNLTDREFIEITGAQTLTASNPIVDFSVVRNIGYSSTDTTFNFAPTLRPTVTSGTLTVFNNSVTVDDSSGVSGDVPFLNANSLGLTLANGYAGTIDAYRGLLLSAPTINNGQLSLWTGMQIPANGAASSSIGIAMGDLTSAGNNQSILLGLTSTQTGDWSIYDTADYPAAFAATSTALNGDKIVLKSNRGGIGVNELIGGLAFWSDDSSLVAPGIRVAGFQAIAEANHTLAAQSTGLTWTTTAAGGAATSTEKMRLIGSGNLGLGTTSPYGKLSVHANNGETNRTLFAVSSSTPTATSTLFIISNTGNVGIGTTTPLNLLDVHGNINISPYASYKQDLRTVLYASSTNFSIAVGQGAGGDIAASVDGTDNTSVGYFALNALQGNTVNAYRNVAVGSNALATMQTGHDNVAIGFYADNSTANTFGDVAIGSFAGTGFVHNLGTTEGWNTFIGYYAGANYNTQGSGQDNIIIGTNANVVDLDASNQLSIGNVLWGTSMRTHSSGAAGPSIPVDGRIGVSTTTPGAQLSVHARAGSTNTLLFAIGSSTAAFATSTLFTVDNIGSTTLGVFGGCSGTKALTTNGSGTILCGDVTSTSFAFPFTATNSFGVAANSTSTPILFTAGLHASTTSQFLKINLTGVGGAIQQNGTNILVGSSTVHSIFVGGGAGAKTNGSSDYNTFVGHNSGLNVDTGANNILVGGVQTSANENLVGGSGNIKVGFDISFPSDGNNQLNVQNILFGTNNSGSAKIPSKGRVGIGTSTPTSRLSVHANNGDTNTFLFTIASSTATATTTHFIVMNDGTIFAPNTTASGSTQTGYWCYDANGQLIRDTVTCLVSALKFKKDIEPLTLGLDAVLNMKPVTFYNKDPQFGTTQQIGFIADWAVDAVPQLVTYDNEGDVHAFNYEQYGAVLTKAVQELYYKVENLSIGKVVRSAEENWQWGAIVFLVLWLVGQQIQISRLRKVPYK